MLEHLGGLLSIFLGVLTVASASAVALMRANQSTLRESNEDLRNRLADVTAARAEEKAECAKQHAEDQARIVELETENTALGRVVTGEVHWVALGQRMEDLYALVTALRDYVTRLMKERP